MNATERARSRFRWGVTEARPSPTDADLAAHLYDVTFTYPYNGTSLSFAVLALDWENAIDLAEVRMYVTGRDCTPCNVIAQKRTLEMSGEAMAHALALEYADEWACRQEAWATRHEPEPAEKINTLGGIKF